MFDGYDLTAKSTTLLTYVAGVLSTIVGSWVANKIHVYDDERKSHRDELNVKILQPLHNVLQQSSAQTFFTNYDARRYNPKASADEFPSEFSPKLDLHDPGLKVERSLDEVLFEDARLNHYQTLMLDWKEFRETWTAFISRQVKWIEKISQDILDQSGLPAHPTRGFAGPYIMHLALAEFIYDRLNLNSTSSLEVKLNGNDYVLSDGFRSLAMDNEQKMNSLIKMINDLTDIHKSMSLEFLKEMAKLELERTTLSRQFSLALAVKKLKSCSLVSFF